MELGLKDVADAVNRKQQNISFILGGGSIFFQTEQRSRGTVYQNFCSSLFGSHFGGIEFFGAQKMDLWF